jgi:hypothetical protein
MQESDKKQARELLIKTKVYRALATIFAVVGLVIFLVLYSQYFEGDIVASLKDPIILVFIVFPFLPSIILSLKGKKAERALQKLLTPGE